MHRLLLTLLVATAATALPACDSGDEPTPDPEFTATAAEGETGTFAGVVATNRPFATGPQQYRFALRADCDCFVLALDVFLAEGGSIEERTYPVEPTPDAAGVGEALGLIGFGDDGAERLYGASGSLVVTDVDGAVVRAEVDLRGVSSSGTGAEVSVRGELVAVLPSQ